MCFFYTHFDRGSRWWSSCGSIYLGSVPSLSPARFVDAAGARKSSAAQATHRRRRTRPQPRLGLLARRQKRGSVESSKGGKSKIRPVETLGRVVCGTGAPPLGPRGRLGECPAPCKAGSVVESAVLSSFFNLMVGSGSGAGFERAK